MKFRQYFMLFITSVVLATTQLYAVSEQEIKKISEAMPAKSTVRPKQPRKLLVFNLCSGYVHSSIPYAARALEIMGEKTGAFKVVQSKDMDIFKPQNLKQFDAVCFNSTTQLKFEDPELRKSLMDFVKGGKGIVGIHGATDNFYEWPEAAAMMGGTFVSHPWTSSGTWAVKIDEPDNVVCASFAGKGFKVNDEIYLVKQIDLRKNSRVLVSLDFSDKSTHDADPTATDVPISWIRGFGKGRVFYCSLGHNHHIFWTTPILQHYLDGIQFALGDIEADTMPSGLDIKILDELLNKAGGYQDGQSREVLADITDFIRNAQGRDEILKNIEKRLLVFLESDASVAAKHFICRELSIIGTKESVGTLGPMLSDEAMSDMARYAMERIGGSAVDKTLRGALAKTEGKLKAGIINSLGQRRDKKSVKVLGELIYDSVPEIASAAIVSLGNIGDSKAQKILSKAVAERKLSNKLQTEAINSYLKCAEELMSQGNKSKAAKIYKQLYDTANPSPIRIAALRGLVTTDKKPEKIIKKVLTGDDAQMQSAVIAAAGELPGRKITQALAENLAKVSVTTQAQLLGILAERGDKTALKTVIKATENNNEIVRVSALEALGALGGSKEVSLLAETAAKTTGLEQKTAGKSLYSLKGNNIDSTIIALIQTSDPGTKVELIKSTSRRTITGAADILIKTAQNSDGKVKLESLKALKIIGRENDLPALVNLLIETQNKANRNEAEKMVIAVSRKINDQNRRAHAVLNVMPSVTEATNRISLVKVLGKIASDEGLAVLRSALNEENESIQKAAISALADWPNDKPMIDLLKVAQSAKNKTHQTLAFRGFVRQIGLTGNRPVDETLKLYTKAMDLAKDIIEKKTVLSGLGKINDIKALDLLVPYLTNEQLQAEAQSSTVQIAKSIYSEHPEKIKPILERVLKNTKNERLQKETQKIINQIK